jgi:ribose transport system permease protein
MTATTARWGEGSHWSRRLEAFLVSGGVVWLLVVAIVVVAAFVSEDFRTLQNLANVSRQGVVLGLVALGQFVVVLTAGVDLSLGMIVRLAAIGTAVGISGFDERTLPTLIGVMGLSALVGAINGLVVTRLRVPPFIATFGMLAVLQGLLLVVASTPQGRTGTTLYDLWAWQLTIDGQGVHAVVIATLTIYVAMHLVLTRTVWGRHVFAVGADARIAAHSGVRIRAVKLSVYVVAALLAGLGGAITAARAGVGDPNAGFGLEFESLAAVVIGGASLAGGRGTVIGVLGGVFLLTVMGNVFNLVGIDVWYQQLIKGALILIGAAAYVARDQRARA